MISIKKKAENSNLVMKGLWVKTIPKNMEKERTRAFEGERSWQKTETGLSKNGGGYGQISRKKVRKKLGENG